MASKTGIFFAWQIFASNDQLYAPFSSEEITDRLTTDLYWRMMPMVREGLRLVIQVETRAQAVGPGIGGEGREWALRALCVLADWEDAHVGEAVYALPGKTGGYAGEKYFSQGGVWEAIEGLKKGDVLWVRIA